MFKPANRKFILFILDLLPSQTCSVLLVVATAKGQSGEAVLPRFWVQ